MYVFLSLFLVIFVVMFIVSINSKDHSLNEEPFAFSAAVGLLLGGVITALLQVTAMISFYAFDVELREDEWFKVNTELYSLQDFVNTSSTGFYMVSTNSDYIAFVKKEDGYIKYKAPSSSIIVQQPDLKNIGYHEYYRCLPGEQRGSWIFNVENSLSCDWNTENENYNKLFVPEGTIIKNFRVGS